MIRADSGSVPNIMILDWEGARWYPSYWEYADTVFVAWFETDWYRWVSEFPVPFCNKHASFEMFARELTG